MSRFHRVLVFSLHRSGSMLVYRICRELAQCAGLRHYSPNGGDVLVPLRRLAEQPEHWLTRPGCFGPMRIFIPAPGMDEARILLHLRDPRDVLVSMFFSYCYSHGGEVAGDVGYRREVADRGIDDFVLRMATDDVAPVVGDYGTGCPLWDLAGNLRQRYQRYVENVLGRPNAVLVRYEDMVADLESWLRAVAGVFGVSDPAQIGRLKAQFVPHLHVYEENPWAHKRKLAPGDHRQKLKPETIGRLNDVLGDVLERLGYPP